MNTIKDREWIGMRGRAAQESWAQICSGLGATAWAGMAVLAHLGIAPIGSIELMFLFAPLVIVPLAMELARVMDRCERLDAVARRLQPVGAGLAGLSLWFPPGRLAGTLACGWLMVCGSMGLGGLVDLLSFLKSEPVHSSGIPSSIQRGETWGTAFLSSVAMGTDSFTVRFAIAIAKIDLGVGGAWFVASRLGLRPIGIQEPIGLLTAVHFHFAGFATALIAAAALRSAGALAERWLKPLVVFVVGMPLVVAAGFVISAEMRMIAAVGFAVSVAGLAVFLRSWGRRAQNSTARVLLQVAAAAVFAGMVLAAVYAITFLRASDVLPVPQMARTHGVLNAVGFCMCGLLGCLVEFDSAFD